MRNTIVFSDKWPIHFRVRSELGDVEFKLIHENLIGIHEIIEKAGRLDLNYQINYRSTSG